MELRVVDLSMESLKGIGHLLTPERWEAPEKGMEYTYADIDLDLGLPPPCSAGVLESVPRPMVLGRMERHLRTREALVALDGEAVLCVAPPQEERERRPFRNYRREDLRRPGPHPGNGRLALDSLPRW